MLGASESLRPEQSAVKTSLPRHAVCEHVQGEHSSLASVDADKSNGMVQREINRQTVNLPITLNINRQKLVLRGFNKPVLQKKAKL